MELLLIVALVVAYAWSVLRLGRLSKAPLASWERVAVASDRAITILLASSRRRGGQGAAADRKAS